MPTFPNAPSPGSDKPESNRQDPDFGGERRPSFSLDLPEIAGARVRIHGSMAIIVAWLAVLGLEAGFDAKTFAHVYFLLFAAVMSLILHEIGHVVLGKRQGLKAREILVLPIGAFTTFRQSESYDGDDAARAAPPPKLGLAACAAGPLVNLLLAVPAFAVTLMLGEEIATSWRSIAMAGMAQKLGWINLGIAAFNLLPAYPFDGGKMLHALLRRRFREGIVRNGLTAAGLLIAALFVAVGLEFDLFFLLLAALVAWGALRERNQGEAAGLLKTLEVRDALTLSFESAVPDDDVVQVLERMLASGQRAIPVVEHGRLVGVVTRERLAKGVAGGRLQVPVRDVMNPKPMSARPHEPLEKALGVMRTAGLAVLPVVEEGVFLGLLRLDEAEERRLEQEAQNEAVSSSPRKLL